MSYLVIRKMFDDGEVLLNETDSLEEAVRLSGNGTREGYIVKTVDFTVSENKSMGHPEPSVEYA